MKSALKFDPDKTGLRTLFRDWQIHTLKYLWGNPMKRSTTKEIWTYVCLKLEKEVSRATVYHFLDELCKKELVGFETSTGRGGQRILFFSEHSEEEFREFMAKNLGESVEKNLLRHQDIENR